MQSSLCRSLLFGVFAIAAATACTDPPKPAPTPAPPPKEAPPFLFADLPLGKPWPVASAPEIKTTLEGSPILAQPLWSCGPDLAGVSAGVSFPLGNEDAITAAVAFGQRLEARFVREGFTDAAGGGAAGAALKDDLFRGKAEGSYQSSFGWDRTERNLRVRCVRDRCDVTVIEAWSACPDGAARSEYAAPAVVR